MATVGRAATVAFGTVTAALVLVVVLVAGADRASAASCTEPVASGQIRVVVVVDPGEVGGPSSACLVVPAGTTGAQALARRASEIGATAPRYNGSGLLCALDGFPGGTACGDRSSGGFQYWAYFDGASGSWVYGNFNPFSRRLADGAIEGWRFVDGAGNGSDPPPRIAPSRSLFPAIIPTTTTTTTAADGTGGQSVPGPGAAASGSTSGPVGVPGVAPSDPGAAGTTGTTNPIGEPSSVAAAGEGTDESVELAMVSVGSRSTDPSWIAVAVVIAMIAALGIGAIVRARRHP